MSTAVLKEEEKQQKGHIELLERRLRDSQKIINQFKRVTASNHVDQGKTLRQSFRRRVNAKWTDYRLEEDASSGESKGQPRPALRSRRPRPHIAPHILVPLTPAFCRKTNGQEGPKEANKGLLRRVLQRQRTPRPTITAVAR
eukprot:SAG31_NODE_336_length_17493_cov_20.694032_14_plen_142_part_00